jgi:TatD DNase family protein
MFLIDAHTHAAPSAPDTAALVNLNPGASAEPAKHCYYSCGIHPADIGKYSLEELRTTLTRIPCSAVGECGLDARFPFEQETVFRKQIRLAEELKLPMVIHCVRKYYDVIRIRKAEHAAMPWLIHGFRGNRETGTALLQAGCLLSLSQVWLMHQEPFPDWLPDGKFLLETDESDIPLPALYEQAIRLRQDSPEQFGKMLQETFNAFIGIGVTGGSFPIRL